MLGRSEGLIWNGVVFGIIGLSFLAPDWSPAHAYEFHFKMRFFCSYLVVSVLTYIYEAARHSSKISFIKEQAKLREEKKKLGEAAEFVGAANRALIKSESLLKHAITIAHLGNWDYDYESQRFWFSEAAFRILGVQSRNDPISRQKWLDLFLIWQQFRRKWQAFRVSNAAEAILSSGTVIISTANCYVDCPIKGNGNVRAGDYVVLSVEDNGIGIEAKDLAHIFEPFHTTKIMGRSGTGPGMAVVCWCWT